MKKLILTGLAVLSAHAAFAQAPNRADTSQLGSVLGFPYVIANGGLDNTIIRLTNTAAGAVLVRCQLADSVGKNAAVTFPTGGNSSIIIDVTAVFGPASAAPGLLFCWAVSANGNRGVQWNYLAGTATIVSSSDDSARWEYSAWAFAARKAGVADGGVVVNGAAGLRTIPLNGTDYDSCGQYLVGQYSPDPTQVTNTAAQTTTFSKARFAAVLCDVDFTTGSIVPVFGVPAISTVTLTVLNEQGVANTGVNVTCVGQWHEAPLPVTGTFGTTDTVAYRVESLGGASACPGLPGKGLIGVQVSTVGTGGGGVITDRLGSTLNGVGQRSGFIKW